MMPAICMASPVQIQRRSSMAFFAVLAVVMVIASYVFVLLLAAACVLFPYWLLINSEAFPAQLGLLLLFGIAVAAAMLWSLIPHRHEFKAPGLLLQRSAQPRLFAELESIAAALNEELPREGYLIGAPNAFVADHGGIMGFGSRRIMGLGLPLLSLLTVSQFRAVLAHEFAHYYGGDTSLGPWVYKTKTSIVRIFENIGSVGALARIAILGLMYMAVTSVLKAYFIAFLRVINLVSRRQEYRADELACIVAGRQNLIDGLEAIHRAAAAWPVYWNNAVAPVLDGGSLAAVGDGFIRFISAPTISSAVEQSLAARLQQEKTKPYDTHPPLRERIAAAQKLPENSTSQDSRRANTLIDELASTELQFVESSFPEIQAGTLSYVSWDEVPLRFTIPSWQKFVSEYAEPLKGVTAEALPDHVSRFPEIGSRIRDPKGMLFSPAQRTARAGKLFAAALGLRMVDAGWTLEVQPAVLQIRRGESGLNPFDAINQLMTGKMSREAWIATCKDLGISSLVLLPDAGDSKAGSDSGAPSQLLLIPDRRETA
jgi:heat shock protein HtpX